MTTAASVPPAPAPCSLTARRHIDLGRVFSAACL